MWRSVVFLFFVVVCFAHTWVDAFAHRRSYVASPAVVFPTRSFRSPIQMTASGDKRISKKKTFSPLLLANYVAGTSLQVTLIKYAMKALDCKIMPTVNNVMIGSIPLSSIMVPVLMYAMSVRSRIFSPFDNTRPKGKEQDRIFKDRRRPSWQPPAAAFAIIWITIGFLRTIAASKIYTATGSLASPALMAFFIHLSIGDTWNSINNVEQRLGTAALGVLFVVGSVFNAVRKYYEVSPTAAYILAPSCVWLSVATALIFAIWRVNYSEWNEPSFLPSKEEGKLQPWFPYVVWKLQGKTYPGY
mmetsp:Transcript_24022/g.40115  ORF Transcript_24022/g.40115 Transcript_24022/m.40115 type:complete len:301 (+) Transcript_24022:57-959(+)